VASYLTNDKMSPELRARIEASIRRGAAHDPTPPRLKATLRLVLLFCIVGSVSALGHRWRQSRQQLADAKAALEAEVSGALTTVPDHASERIRRARSWLTLAAETDAADHVAPSLRRPGAMARLLERRALYVRGPQRSFRTDARLSATVTESTKDAFVTCLIDPPEGRTEQALLPYVRRARRGGPEWAKKTSEVRRLRDLFAAEPMLAPGWLEGVRRASDVRELHELRAEAEAADLHRAAEAAEAELLLYVIDEPKAEGTVSELDGASKHAVRLGLVDLAADEPLLRLRRSVDPSWISDKARIDSGRSLNACRLAVDLRAALEPVPAEGTQLEGRQLAGTQQEGTQLEGTQLEETGPSPSASSSDATAGPHASRAALP
jgi:hypothetical protein